MPHPYRPAERVRQIVTAANTEPYDVAAVLAVEVAGDAGCAAVLDLLARVAAGAVDVAARATGQPFGQVLANLLGAVPGPPGTDPDLGV